MPYITKNRKLALLEGNETPQNAGELNYVLTMVVLDFLTEMGVCYTTINDISGALTECLAEFRARITRPYESIKMHRNGDVYHEAMDMMLEHTSE